MNNLKLGKELLEIPDDVDVTYDYSRGEKFPNGTYYPNANKIVVSGTEVSFERWGIIEILLHEKVHWYRFKRGDKDWDKHDGEFWLLYGKFYEDLMRKICKE